MLDEYLNVPLVPIAIAPAYDPDPKVPEPVIASMPPLAAIVVSPVYVLVLLKFKVPVPAFVKLPVPLITPTTVVEVPSPPAVKLAFKTIAPVPALAIDPTVSLELTV